MNINVPSIRFYNENDDFHNSSSLNQEEESSCSSDFLFPKNIQNAVDKLKEDDSSISDQDENSNLKDDIDYCPLPIESDEDDNYENSQSSDLEDEEKVKKKRKNASKRNPYQDRRRIKKQKIDTIQLEDSEDGEIKFTELDNGFKLPTKLWDKLYPYQQAGIQWLWELHQQSTGGILGDEPGNVFCY